MPTGCGDGAGAATVAGPGAGAGAGGVAFQLMATAPGDTGRRLSFGEPLVDEPGTGDDGMIPSCCCICDLGNDIDLDNAGCFPCGSASPR